jgi:hypothetical protein
MPTVIDPSKATGAQSDPESFPWSSGPDEVPEQAAKSQAENEWAANPFSETRSSSL